jgi:hypothetical protein
MEKHNQNDGGFHPDPNNLIMMKGVAADRTMREFEQIIRIDFYPLADGSLKIQVTFDRRHIHQPKLSKPMGYVWFSEVFQLIDLAKAFMVAAMVKSIIGKYGTDIKPDSILVEETISLAFKSMMDMLKEDVVFLSKLYLKNVIKRIKELQGEREE